MASVKHQYVIKQLAFPVDGYKFDVQVWISVDGGKNFYHCGIGKFCKTEEEVMEYITEYKKENPDDKE